MDNVAHLLWVSLPVDKKGFTFLVFKLFTSVDSNALSCLFRSKVMTFDSTKYVPICNPSRLDC